jgi:hypothetical protein
MKFPDTAVGLIDELDRMYPERLPEIGDSLEAVHRRAGNREVVLFLKQWRGQTRRDPVVRRRSR